MLVNVHRFFHNILLIQLAQNKCLNYIYVNCTTFLVSVLSLRFLLLPVQLSQERKVINQSFHSPRAPECMLYSDTILISNIHNYPAQTCAKTLCNEILLFMLQV